MRKMDEKMRNVESEESTGRYAPEETLQAGIDDYNNKGPLTSNPYTQIIQSLFEKTRKRVSTYYCPSLSCNQAFWNADTGYECPRCGSLGIISEFKYTSISDDTKERNIVGYIDNLGRLICSECIMRYGVQNEVGLIVYDDTDPFCFEVCELCKRHLE